MPNIDSIFANNNRRLTKIDKDQLVTNITNMLNKGDYNLDYELEAHRIGVGSYDIEVLDSVKVKDVKKAINGKVSGFISEFNQKYDPNINVKVKTGTVISSTGENIEGIIMSYGGRKNQLNLWLTDKFIEKYLEHIGAPLGGL